jgi:beta-lactamase class A
VADVQEPKLRSYLQDVAMRYDRQGTGVAFDPNLMTFNAGGAGYTLDIEASISLVREALMRPRDRYVRLVMQQQEGEAMSMDSLNQAIRQYLNLQRIEVDGPNYVVSVGVIDLETGKETWINPDVAYSSMSTIKIPILLNAFANLPFAPDNDVRWLMGASILCSNNSASNFLMQLVGEGANERRQMEDGLQKLMALMQTLGAPNTYINAPIFVDPEAQPWSIPAPVTTSLRTPDAKADLFSQTTAQDMGTLMQHIYDCAQYNSGLMAIAPDKFTASECQQILELLSGNVINRLIELGVPHGTKVAHKNGWGGAPGGRSGANVSDAAIVFSPGGDYVLVVYIWETFATESGTSTTMTTWETTEGISRIVYNYFNPDQPMLSSRAPINPLTAVDCVLPGTTAELDLTNIRRGRFDDQGNMLATACYGWPTCYTPPNVPIAPLPPQ